MGCKLLLTTNRNMYTRYFPGLSFRITFSGDATVIAERCKVSKVDLLQSLDVLSRYRSVCRPSTSSLSLRPVAVPRESDPRSESNPVEDIPRVVVERLVVSDEVVVDAARLTHGGLRRPVEVM